MKIIGITGSSGSGKTSVAKLLEEKYKTQTIDADKVVKEMSVPGTEYIKRIEECFGKEILLQDGNLNKKLLAEKIYQKKEELEKLNNITFKYVVDEIKKRVVNVSYELPKSFVLTYDKKTKEKTMYISPISSVTLLKRIENVNYIKE